MDRAIRFYQALGLTVEDANPHWANLTCGDGNIALQAFRPAEPAVVHTMVILTVDDLDAAIASARTPAEPCASATIIRMRRSSSHMSRIPKAM